MAAADKKITYTATEVAELFRPLSQSMVALQKENAELKRKLEHMNDLKPDTLDDEKKAIITGFIADRNITRKDITTYAPFFPDKAMRTLSESELIYSVMP